LDTEVKTVPQTADFSSLASPTESVKFSQSNNFVLQKLIQTLSSSSFNLISSLKTFVNSNRGNGNNSDYGELCTTIFIIIIVLRVVAISVFLL
jgi:hypothetical protein